MFAREELSDDERYRRQGEPERSFRLRTDADLDPLMDRFGDAH